MEGLITKLLEATHGQWIYRNLTMHDHVAGLMATQDKEHIQKEIQKQMDIGGKGWKNGIHGCWR
jgi:hypothetical protein